jgi:DNA transformation protein and related proteins
MSLDDSDIAFAVDLFAALGGVTTRKMFGGMCLYREGTVFALMSSTGQLFLKTRDPEGLFGQRTEQFHSMPYWSMPEAALDDAETATELARRALALL